MLLPASFICRKCYLVRHIVGWGLCSHRFLFWDKMLVEQHEQSPCPTESTNYGLFFGVFSYTSHILHISYKYSTLIHYLSYKHKTYKVCHIVGWGLCSHRLLFWDKMPINQHEQNPCPTRIDSLRFVFEVSGCKSPNYRILICTLIL